jgi:predicted transcriptional regulator
MLLKANPLDAPRDVQAALDDMERADLISPASGGEKYHVTAKGLKVARDLEKMSPWPGCS